jgi:psiF repeat
MEFNTMLLVAATGVVLTTGYAAAENAQQEKMQTCNADATAKNLKGDERKAFMKSCLSGK